MTRCAVASTGAGRGGLRAAQILIKRRPLSDHPLPSSTSSTTSYVEYTTTFFPSNPNVPVAISLGPLRDEVLHERVVRAHRAAPRAPRRTSETTRGIRNTAPPRTACDAPTRSRRSTPSRGRCACRRPRCTARARRGRDRGREGYAPHSARRRTRTARARRRRRGGIRTRIRTRTRTRIVPFAPLASLEKCLRSPPRRRRASRGSGARRRPPARPPVLRVFARGAEPNRAAAAQWRCSAARAGASAEAAAAAVAADEASSPSPSAGLRRASSGRRTSRQSSGDQSTRQCAGRRMPLRGGSRVGFASSSPGSPGEPILFSFLGDRSGFRPRASVEPPAAELLLELREPQRRGVDDDGPDVVEVLELERELAFAAADVEHRARA